MKEKLKNIAYSTFAALSLSASAAMWTYQNEIAEYIIKATRDMEQLFTGKVEDIEGGSQIVLKLDACNITALVYKGDSHKNCEWDLKFNGKAVKIDQKEGDLADRLTNYDLAPNMTVGQFSFDTGGINKVMLRLHCRDMWNTPFVEMQTSNDCVEYR